MRSSLVLLAIAISSCATSGDPSEGGLFCHSGAKFEKRAQDKHAEIARLRAENDRLSQKIITLQNQL